MYVMALAALATLIATALLTGVVRKVALSRGILDVPNARSSHVAATPRGGGLAIVLSTTLALVILAVAGSIAPRLCLALTVGGAAVAAVGFADDRYGASPTTRLLVQAAAAAWAVASIGGMPEILLDDRGTHLGWVGDALGIVGVIWALNLFNFMDGIDGIAASEAVFVTWGALVPMALFGISNAVSAASLVIGAACLGFLPWNWPPAKIFLGDVGSGYVGYAVAVLALESAHQRPAALWVWLILGGVFFVDATVTLSRRFMRGERVYEGHRIHAYQWLARRWGNHRRVTVAVLFVNVLWLLPCAAYATIHASYAATVTLVAYAPLVAIAVAAGSGRRERTDSHDIVT
jgi:Fuc2NAc and GlcNAc transferase